MPIVSDPSGKELSAETLHRLEAQGGFTLAPKAFADWQQLLGSLDAEIRSVLAEDDYVPRPDLTKYPRSDIAIPGLAETDGGAWSTRLTLRSTQPSTSLLAGRQVVVKDNTAVAGVRCMNGLPQEWVPDFDATVVTRVLDAGAVITGKAVCENACLEPTSDTAASGPVQNPYAEGYASGGSSSGCGRLVAKGAVDMALGCDQGGSVRIPASFCGIVGLKPTHGLVPYTGILSLHPEIDHCGPMTRTVQDNALLLEAVAGPDGIDDRQPPFFPPNALQFSTNLEAFFQHQPSDRPLQGLKVGVLKEGFALSMMNVDVAAAVRACVADLASLGADVVQVSVPEHTFMPTLWSCILPYVGGREMMGCGTGRKALHITDKYSGPHPTVGQADFDAYAVGAQSAILSHLYVADTYGARLHAKATNLARKGTAAYDAVLKDVDVLVMPTLPKTALPHLPADTGPMERMLHSSGIINNTAPFNTTGHPALSLPVGFVPSPWDPKIKLPTAIQIVGRQFEDLTCYKVAKAWETAYDWKTKTFGF